MRNEEFIEHFRKDLIRKAYAKSTILVYTEWLTKLIEFYHNKNLEKITFEEIKEYIEHLINRLNISASAINQAFQSYNYFFNNLNSRNFDFKKINKPKRLRSNPDILTTKEILQIIEGTIELKSKLIIAIAYSSAMDIAEVQNLRINDVDLIRDIVKVRNKKGKVVRNSPLARYVKTLISEYLREIKPKTYLFESPVNVGKFSTSSIRRVFKNQVLKERISKKITFKTLKYSHIMHSGRPLLFVLKDLKLHSAQSLEFFNEIKHRNSKDKRFSPLDKISLLQEREHPINREYFEDIILGITNKAEQDYLKEALTCMSVGSLRAGIIFAWNAGVLNLRHKCFNHGRTSLNNAIKKFYPSAKEIKKIEDFAYIKDSTLLLTAQELGEIDKGEKDSLEDCLDLRNKCGHPSNYKPKSLKASSFMEELINIVFK